MIKKILSFYTKIKYLKSYGWYRNLHGGFTHSHCMMTCTLKEIWNMSIDEIREIA